MNPKIDESFISEVYSVGGASAVMEAIAEERQEATNALGEAIIERRRHRVEMWMWLACLGITALSVVFGLYGLIGWGNEATHAQELSQRAKTYRVMLFENKVDPDTGKVFGK